MLTESSGVFSACHATVSPVPFYSVRPQSAGPGWGRYRSPCRLNSQVHPPLPTLVFTSQLKGSPTEKLKKKVLGAQKGP